MQSFLISESLPLLGPVSTHGGSPPKPTWPGWPARYTHTVPCFLSPPPNAPKHLTHKWWDLSQPRMSQWGNAGWWSCRGFRWPTCVIPKQLPPCRHSSWEKRDFPSRIITPLGSTLISLEQSGLSVRMGSYCGIAYSVRAILGNFLSQTGHEI